MWDALKIRNKPDSAFYHEVFINGNELHHVLSVNLNMEATCLPIATVTFYPGKIDVDLPITVITKREATPTMRFVIIKHPGNSGKYLFTVPSEEVTLAPGDYVFCTTSRGPNELGVCCTEAFRGDPETVTKFWGTTIANLKPVTAKLTALTFTPLTTEEETQNE